MFRVWLNSVGIIARFGKPHAAQFVCGAAAAIGVVSARLILPWPIKAMLQPWLSAPGQAVDHVAWGTIAALAAGFFAVVVLLGLLDFMERLWFARFAIGTVRDLREAAFESARRRARGGQSGDLVARLIGDTARIKAGLKGFLVHVATNAALLVGVTCVLLWIYPPMGAIFAGVCLLLTVILTIGAARVYSRAAKYRHKEGRLAERIRSAVADDGPDASELISGFEAVNQSSSRAEASLTQEQGRSTWTAHALFGLAALGAVGAALHGLSRGHVEVGSVVAIAMYTLMLRAPMVQMVRQGTRTGKIVACVERVASLFEQDDLPARTTATLRQGLVVENVRRRARSARRKRSLLKIRDLDIPTRQRLAVIGPPSSGKSLLLRLLAGQWEAGQIRWDGQPVNGPDATATPHAALATASLSWPRLRLSEVLGVNEDPALEELANQLLRTCGAESMVKSLERGLATKVRSSELSSAERRVIAISRAALSGAPLILLDDVVDDRSRRESERLLTGLFETCPDTTIIVTLRRRPAADLFDRIITMRRGEIIDDTADPALATSDGLGIGER